MRCSKPDCQDLHFRISKPQTWSLALDVQSLVLGVWVHVVTVVELEMTGYELQKYANMRLVFSRLLDLIKYLSGSLAAGLSLAW